MKRLKHVSALAVLGFVFLGGTATHAGKLDDFENDATGANKKNPSNHGQRPNNHHNDDQHPSHNNDYRDQQQEEERRRELERLRELERQREWERRRELEREHSAWERQHELLELERERREQAERSRNSTIIVVPPSYPGGGQQLETLPDSRRTAPRMEPLPLPLPAPEPDWIAKNRAPGDLIQPFFRFDYNQGELSASITAKDYQLEAGFGPIALLRKESRLMEDGSHDELKSKQNFILFRFSLIENTEFDFGIGNYSLSGNSRTNESAYSLGVKYHLPNGLGFEYRPMWVNGNDIKLSEHEVTALYHMHYIAAKVGYHWLLTEDESLKGPFVGLAISF